EQVTDEELVARGYLMADGKLVENGKEYLVFYVGDYDAASWLSQTTPTLWDDPNRGKVPLMWCISPVLAQRVPMAMEYRRSSATPNDYFAAADNRSEEHTSELQSRENLVCRLLLEKKKKD